MEVKIPIEAKRLADMMTTAIESGVSRYWCDGVYLVKPCKGDEYPEYETSLGKSSLWYADPKLYESDFVLEIHEIEEEGGDEVTKHLVDFDMVRTGLALMAKNSPAAFGEFMNDNEDGEVADLFLQYITLGEVVYG